MQQGLCHTDIDCLLFTNFNIQDLQLGLPETTDNFCTSVSLMQVGMV